MQITFRFALKKLIGEQLIEKLDIFLNEEIGSGGFGTVRKGWYRDPYTHVVHHVAVKKQNYGDAANMERNLIICLDRSRAVEIHYAFLQNDATYLVMELCRGKPSLSIEHVAHEVINNILL